METIFSTQGIMVMLLGAYAYAMWLFLSSAPKVHTVMVSNMSQAQEFYEGVLKLPVASVPLHYYYGYDYRLGAPADMVLTQRQERDRTYEGVWYQLQKNVQLHVVPGTHAASSTRARHLCFNRTCIEQILLSIQLKSIKHKVLNEHPLKFLVKDLGGNVIEVVEAEH
jgi:hypothetical protein